MVQSVLFCIPIRRLLLVPIEVVAKLDTCIEVTQLMSHRLRDLVHSYLSYAIIVRSYYRDDLSLWNASSLVEIATIASIYAQVDRVTIAE